MIHTGTRYLNAVLTPNGRRRMVACVVDKGWIVEATGSLPRARLVSTIVSVGLAEQDVPAGTPEPSLVDAPMAGIGLWRLAMSRDECSVRAADSDVPLERLEVEIMSWAGNLAAATARSGRSRREVTTQRGGMSAIRADALVQMAEQTLAAGPVAAERGDVGCLQLVVDTESLSDTDTGWGDAHSAATGSLLQLPVGGCVTFALWWWSMTTVTAATRANSGLTDLANLISLFGFHHRQIHEGGWSVAIVDREITWSDPEGIPMTIEPPHGDADRLFEHQSNPIQSNPRSGSGQRPSNRPAKTTDSTSPSS